MFSLESVLMSPNRPGEFLEKKLMIEKLSEYRNLTKAIGALSYVRTKMTNVMPLVFNAWKEYVFERKANRLHDMLSSQSPVENTTLQQNDDTQNHEAKSP